MKKFINWSILFLLPVFLLSGLIEFYFRNNENAFRIKAEYLRKNTDSIEVLFLGSSRSQNAINPDLMSLKSANVAMGSQDLKIDSALFFHYAAQLKSLKYVVLELDYYRLEYENSKTYYRIPWYYIFYDVEVYPLKWKDKISLYATNPAFFNENIKNLIFDNANSMQTINKYGFVEKNYTNQFLTEFQYDSLKINATANERLQNRHRENSILAFNKNSNIVTSIVEYCFQHNIEPILISTPVYYTYAQTKIKEKENRRNDFIKSLQAKRVRYYDFENSDIFSLKHFSNDDHLNYEGSKIFTTILNDSINIISRGQ